MEIKQYYKNYSVNPQNRRKRGKGGNNRWEQYKVNGKMVDINPTTSTITHVV